MSQLGGLYKRLRTYDVSRTPEPHRGGTTGSDVTVQKRKVSNSLLGTDVGQRSLRSQSAGIAETSYELTWCE
jgi:hypothetical protein